MAFDSIRDPRVHLGQTLDQREMGARQGPRGQFRLDQGAQRRQLFDPLVGQFGRRDPARGRQAQRPFRDQPPHRLACRGHRDVIFSGKSTQGQRGAG